MTVAIQTKHAHPDADLTKVAVEMGVFVDQAPDVTGGLDELRQILKEKSSANPTVDFSVEAQVVESSTVEPATILVTGVRAFVSRLKAWARRAVETVRETLAWLASPFTAIAERRRARREKPDYTGRHRTATAWYGQQRSTASRVAIQRRRMSGQQPDDSEPALPEYWVSHMARFIETTRGHEDTLHPKRGYQFICS